MTELGGAGTSNCSYVPNVHGSIGFALPRPEARTRHARERYVRRAAQRVSDPGALHRGCAWRLRAPD
jgi:hypothetical protein